MTFAAFDLSIFFSVLTDGSTSDNWSTDFSSQVSSRWSIPIVFETRVALWVRRFVCDVCDACATSTLFTVWSVVASSKWISSWKINLKYNCICNVIPTLFYCIFPLFKCTFILNNYFKFSFIVLTILRRQFILMIKKNFWKISSFN